MAPLPRTSFPMAAMRTKKNDETTENNPNLPQTHTHILIRQSTQLPFAKTTVFKFKIQKFLLFKKKTKCWDTSTNVNQF
jgi:hypothetical protein